LKPDVLQHENELFLLNASVNGRSDTLQ